MEQKPKSVSKNVTLWPRQEEQVHLRGSVLCRVRWQQNKLCKQRPNMSTAVIDPFKHCSHICIEDCVCRFDVYCIFCLLHLGWGVTAAGTPNLYCIFCRQKTYFAYFIMCIFCVFSVLCMSSLAVHTWPHLAPVCTSILIAHWGQACTASSMLCTLGYIKRSHCWW